MIKPGVKRFIPTAKQIMTVYLYYRYCLGDKQVSYPEMRDLPEYEGHNTPLTNTQYQMKNLNLMRTIGDRWHRKGILTPTGIERAKYYIKHRKEYKLEPFVDRLGLQMLDNDQIKEYNLFMGKISEEEM